MFIRYSHGFVFGISATQEPESAENDDECIEGQEEDEVVQAMMAEMCTLEETDEPEDLWDQVVSEGLCFS